MADCICIICGKNFTAKRSDAKYCSKECMIKSITIHPKTPADSIAVKFRLLDEYKIMENNLFKERLV